MRDLSLSPCAYTRRVYMRASALHRNIANHRANPEFAWRAQRSHPSRALRMVAAINKRPHQGADLISIPITSPHLFRDSTLRGIGRRDIARL